MKYILMLIILFLNASALGSINYVNQAHLGFIDQNYLIKFDSNTLSYPVFDISKASLNYLKALSANVIYQVSKDEIVFDGVCKDKKYNYCLYWGSLQNGEYGLLGVGELIKYLVSSHALFYVSNDGYLVVANYSQGKLSDIHVIGKTFLSFMNIVSIDKDNVVFEDPYHDGEVYHYNLIKKTLNKLPISFCSPKLWIPSKNKLLCSNNSTFFLTSLNADGLRNEFLSLKKEHFMGVMGYDEEKDQLIIVKPSLFLGVSQREAIYVYDFQSKKKTFLKYQKNG